MRPCPTCMRRSLVLVILVWVAVLGGPVTPARACDCASLTAAEAIASADAVVDGGVTDLDEPLANLWDPPEVAATVQVTDVLEGAVSAGEITVTTAREGPTCGAGLEEGKAYRLHLRWDDGWRTDLCSGNQELAGRSVPVAAELTGAELAGAGLAAAIAGAVLVLRRRVRRRSAG